MGPILADRDASACMQGGAVLSEDGQDWVDLDIVVAMASVLESVSLSTIDTCPSDRQLALFWATRAPGLSLGEYQERLLKYFKCSRECFVVASIFIDRLVQAQPDFVVTECNVHRVVLSSLTIAAKYHDDIHYSNDWYAKVGGVTNYELNMLESTFMTLIGWNLHVTEAQFKRYHAQLRLHAHGKEAPTCHVSGMDVADAEMVESECCANEPSGNACTVAPEASPQSPPKKRLEICQQHTPDARKIVLVEAPDVSIASASSPEKERQPKVIDVFMPRCEATSAKLGFIQKLFVERSADALQRSLDARAIGEVEACADRPAVVPLGSSRSSRRAVVCPRRSEIAVPAIAVNGTRRKR